MSRGTSAFSVAPDEIAIAARRAARQICCVCATGHE